MKDRQDMGGLWQSSRRYIFLVAFGILLYEAMENFTVVKKSISAFFDVISPVFIGLAAAFITNIPMSFLEKKVFPKWHGSLKRGGCLLIAMLLVAAVLAGSIIIVAPRLVDSIKTLAENFDRYTSGLAEWGTHTWERLNFSQDVTIRIQKMVEELLEQLDKALSNLVTWALKTTVSAAGVLFDIIIGTIISVHALYSKENLIRQGKKLVKAVLREDTAAAVINVAARTNTSLHNYVFGMLTECFILGLLCFIGMSLFNMPYALLVSVIVGMAQMVPVVGAWASAAICTLLILVVDPGKALFFLVMLLAVQQIEGNIIYPRVVGNAVGISGLWVLIAVLLGAGLFGLVGAILCVPIMAVLYTLTGEWVNKRLEAKRAAGQDMD